MPDKIRLRDFSNLIFVTGNGFDLACGLKTHYSDFFDDLIKNKYYCNVDLYDLVKSRNNMAIFNSFISHPDLSLWELYLTKVFMDKSYKDKTWIDIEVEMENTFKDDGIWNEIYNQVGILIKYFDINQFGILRTNNYYQTFTLVLLNRYQKDLVKEENGKYVFACENFVKVLKKELSIFENKFSKYLISLNLSQNGFYEVRNHNFIQMLKHVENIKTIYPCTFNYTGNPIDANDSNPKNKIVFEGLHGTIDNPILGITNIVSSVGNLEILAKGFRRLDAKLPTYHDILSGVGFASVAFYGVSFGKNDYADFETLFEHVGSNNSVIIFYTNYDDDPDYFHTIYSAVRTMFIEVKRATSNEHFDQMAQDGKVIFHEIPKEELKTIDSQND